MDLRMIDAAKEIIGAVLDKDWTKMLEYFPEGVVHRASTFDKPDDFLGWETYDEYARYTAPARDMLIDKCLQYAKQILE